MQNVRKRPPKVFQALLEQKFLPTFAPNPRSFSISAWCNFRRRLPPLLSLCSFFSFCLCRRSFNDYDRRRRHSMISSVFSSLLLLLSANKIPICKDPPFPSSFSYWKDPLRHFSKRRRKGKEGKKDRRRRRRPRSSLLHNKEQLNYSTYFLLPAAARAFTCPRWREEKALGRAQYRPHSPMADSSSIEK